MTDYTEQIVWHEVITRPPTEEENEEFKRMTGKAAKYILDFQAPEEDDEVLVKTKSGVFADICVEGEYGLALEIFGGWENVLAWAEMPKGVRADG